MSERIEGAVVQSINNYSRDKGIAILIELLITRESKSLRTGIMYERGKRECLLEIGDSVDAHIYEDRSTQISSYICERECPFGGQNKPNQPVKCNIYKKS